jgi:ubiquinone/menaquinone biosynthesis C-methylase UbiE
MSEPTQVSPAQLFDQFFRPALFTPWARSLLQRAAPQSGEQVLDLACGTGTVAQLVAPLVGAEGSVVGVDINPGMLAVAQGQPKPAGAAVTWRQGDATALDLPDDFFDLVLCQQGLQFFADRAAAVREVRRMLKSGGRFVLNVWQSSEHQPVYNALGESEARHLNVPVAAVSTPSSFGDPGALQTLLEEAGFTNVEVSQESIEVSFPSAERFVYFNLSGAAAFLPQVWQDEARRNNLIEAVNRDIAPVLQRYCEGDGLRFPTALNFAIARK